MCWPCKYSIFLVASHLLSVLSEFLSCLIDSINIVYIEVAFGRCDKCNSFQHVRNWTQECVTGDILSEPCGSGI